MPTIETGRFGHLVILASCVVAATLAAAPGIAQAAVPELGEWQSGSVTAPRVGFEVRGPARARTVQRVSFPIFCQRGPSPDGWGTTTFARTRAGERFTASVSDTVIRGRFTTRNRAVVTVRTSATDCQDSRRFVVLHRGRRTVVRTGRFLSLLSDGASMGLETEAFGRIVMVEYTEGSLPSRCSDGSQRPLRLAGPAEQALAAPISPSGRFRISARGGPDISIQGSFDGGSVAAFVDLSVVLPDGTSCTAATQALVGSLAFPLSDAGQSETFPAPPGIVQPPGQEAIHPS
jgi:hypothetical protein